MSLWFTYDVTMKFTSRPWLKTLREKAGLSAASLGESLGVTKETVFRWESGHKRPAHEHLFKLEAILGPQVVEAFRREAADTPAVAS